MLAYEPLNIDIAGLGPRLDWTGLRLDDQPIAAGLGAALAARTSDLLDIAVAAYVTDRLRARPSADDAAAEGWGRRLPLRLGVRDRAFWTRADVDAELHELLGWLTDDVWELDLTAGPRRLRVAEAQQPLFGDRSHSSSRFGLFSGGLDSYLGAARELEDATELVLVSATTSPAMGALQTRTVAALRARTVTPIRHLVIPVGLRTGAIRELTGKREAPEPSQRTRGLLFHILGAVSALTAGAGELRVFENGVGAMNLPLTAAQYGAHNTRAMHPETLVRVGRLMTLVAEHPFAVVNPSFGFTKAQMCQQLPDPWREAVSTTISCDTGLTHRASRTRLCGTCTSCLLRRQAMRAGGMRALDEAEAGGYRVDVHTIDRASDPTLRRLHYMLDQTAQFQRAVEAGDPTPALARAFPDLRRVWAALTSLGEPAPPALTTRLLGDYCAEWRAFGHPLQDRYLSPATAATVLA